jgi:hypothetical protein
MPHYFQKTSITSNTEYTQSVTTTRPRRIGCSTSSCALAISTSGIRSAISKPAHPAANAALRSCAASIFISAGKSSLPKKNIRTFLNTSCQNGISGSAVLVAYVAIEPPNASNSISVAMFAPKATSTIWSTPSGAIILTRSSRDSSASKTSSAPARLTVALSDVARTVAITYAPALWAN